MQVEKTLTVTIDETSYVVANMSEPVKQLISYMDDWRQKEADTTSDLLMVRSALRDIQNSLMTTINAEKQAAAEAEQASNNEQADAGPETLTEAQ